MKNYYSTKTVSRLFCICVLKTNYQQQIQQQNETCRNAELSFLKTKQKQFEPLPSTVFIIIFIPLLLEFSHSNYI